ncbi:MAG: 4-hydroxy-tetrahydrodipicolinate synthase [Bacteroidetes bacterium]|nr:4-hydroxy-tetrahydrodipicolinate synthase [Bacteroidota bacterium]
MSLIEKFAGTGVAIVTPFNSDSTIDFNALTKIVNHIIEGGCEYIVVLGTTGESVTLSSGEKKLVMRCVVEVTKNRVALMLGMGGNNTQELVSQLKSTDFTGFSAVLSVSPYYNKPNQEGIYKHYVSVAEASPLPVLLYNVPGRTGANMTAETTLRLAAHSNIFGIKEASGNLDQCMDILNQKPADFMVISGDDALTLPLIALGMNGVISVVANAYPKIYSAMARHALEGDFKSARVLHYNLLNTIKNMFADGSPGGVKAYLNLMNLCQEKVREPLEKVGEQTKAKIIKDYKNLLD